MQRPEVLNQWAISKRSNLGLVDVLYCYEEIVPGVLDEFSWSGK